ncbi:MAG: hypothetical protein KatS3mg131_3145 [Candidatus Tectimicrobiota bacterium]|nr:MAG: hypothetical protein KatS3mg131_3145 [Candidatus Tectomicrobia bacterium]
MSDQALVDKLERVWRSLEELGATLSEEEWKRPTDCPKWSVQDHLSHIVGTEATLLGRPAPEHTPQDMSHVKNDIARRNEIQVDWRRSRRGAEVLAEFREVTGERLRRLRAMTPEDFAAPTQTPVGPGTVRDFLEIRIFDCWVHEQDMRRAVGRPGHLEGPVAEHAVGRIALAMPYVVGKKAQAPDGTTVVFEVTGPAGRTLAIGVEGRRAKPLETVPASPTVRLTMDVETFNCLGCGRWDPEWVLQQGKVRLSGDTALGETIVRQMNFMI